MSTPGPPEIGDADASGVDVCYRHPDTPTAVLCQRCERPICSQCMHQASVGVHCPECTRGASQRVYTTRNLPGARGIVTTALVVLNLIAWVGGMAFYDASPSSTGTVFAEFGTNAFGIAGLGEWWRLLTGGFIHSGLIHIGFNMYLLWQLGKQLERIVGPVDFTAVYFTALLGGSFGAMLLEPLSSHGGASGAVFGLFGFMAMLYRSRGIPVLSSGIGRLILLNLLITFAVPFVSQGGHVGGLLAGGVLGAVYFGVTPGVGSTIPSKARLAVTIALGVALFVGGLLVSNAAI